MAASENWLNSPNFPDYIFVRFLGNENENENENDEPRIIPGAGESETSGERMLPRLEQLERAGRAASGSETGDEERNYKFSFSRFVEFLLFLFMIAVRRRQKCIAERAKDGKGESGAKEKRISCTHVLSTHA